jgi:hypothetical protein
MTTLLELGADVDVKNIWGQTPLDCITIAQTRARWAKPSNNIRHF